MVIKAVLLDFDGTLVKEDLLSVLAEIVGKREYSEHLNEDFQKGIKPGLVGLIERINLLQGISLTQVEEKLHEENYLMQGARELLDYLRQNNIITILASGSILPVLAYYQKLLGINYIVGSSPKIKENTIVGISEEDFPHYDYKLFESKKILQCLRIHPLETVAIGDSPGDKSRFLFAGKSIAINPKEGIELFADYVIENDLTRAVAIIEELSKQPTWLSDNLSTSDIIA